MIGTLNDGEQPCREYKTPHNEEIHFGPEPHQCPVCGGTRYFCANCCRDHHIGGWETCQKHKVAIVWTIGDGREFETEEEAQAEADRLNAEWRKRDG